MDAWRCHLVFVGARAESMIARRVRLCQGPAKVLRRSEGTVPPSGPHPPLGVLGSLVYRVGAHAGADAS